MILANRVRFSSLPQIVYEFHKFTAKKPGLLHFDHSSRSFPHSEYRLRPKIVQYIDPTSLPIIWPDRGGGVREEGWGRGAGQIS